MSCEVFKKAGMVLVGILQKGVRGKSRELMSDQMVPCFSSPQPSTSSVASDEKVDYVQVDKEKTQALQSTMQEWTDVRQSSEPAKGMKQ